MIQEPSSRIFDGAHAAIRRMNSCLLEESSQPQAEYFDPDLYSDNKDSISKPSYFSFGLENMQPVELFNSMLEEQTEHAAPSQQARPPVRRSQSEIWRDEHQLHSTRLASDQTPVARHSRNLSLGEHKSELCRSSIDSTTCKLDELGLPNSSLSHMKAPNLFNLEEISSMLERESCGSETPKWAFAPTRKQKDLQPKHLGFSATLEEVSQESAGRPQALHHSIGFVGGLKSAGEIERTATEHQPERITPSFISQADDHISEDLSGEEAIGSPIVAGRISIKCNKGFAFEGSGSMRPYERGCKLDPAGEHLRAEKASNHSHRTAASAEKQTSSTAGTPSTRISLALDRKPSPGRPRTPPQSLKDAQIIVALVVFALFLLAVELA
jgi:hypothetical protein